MMIANSMFSYFKSQFVQRTYVSMLHFLIIFSVLSTLFVEINAVACPRAARHGRPPPRTCNVKDPNHLPKTSLQKWFSRADFDDLFPKANQGWGPHKCLPYSYEAFIIASRYFPEFGTASVVGPTTKSTFTKKQLQRRDVAAFFAHILQETGETDYDLFNSTLSPTEARECFYRGGLYHFYEGGPRSPFFPSTLEVDAVQPNDGKTCFNEGRYCHEGIETATWYPCFNETDLSNENPTDESEGSGEEDRKTYGGCYFGRGPLQLSWNYNYGQFQHFLAVHGIKVDLLANPQLLITKLDPPLAMLSALWFYMTPQPPKPAMHDVIMGNWRSSQKNQRAGYKGSVFGPTSLIINKECHGEDTAEEPGPPGENRRIKAFRWFSDKFNLKIENERLLSCKGMLEPFDAIPHKYSWQPDWSTMWKSQPCDCAPAAYPGALPYYDSKFYPERMVKENDRNRLRCVYNLYKNKEMFRITPENSPCIKHSVKIRLNKDGI